MEFNKLIFLDNIDYLCKKNDAKISKLETDLNLSEGYFSRYKLNTSNAAPKVETIISICNYFKVDFESLVFSNLKSPMKNEQKVINFLKKIISMTENSKLDWKKIDIFLVQVSPQYPGHYYLYPGLFEVEQYNITYKQKFVSKEREVYKNFFVANITKNDLFMIVPSVNKQEGKEIDLNTLGYDLFFYDELNDEKTEIASSINTDNSEINFLSKKLQLKIIKYLDDIKLDEKANSLIDIVMKNN